MKKQLRYWMSGCAAIISLALGGLGDASADDVDPRSGSWQTSRFDMPQTLQRLQSCAPQHGLSVIACWTPVRNQAPDAQSGASPAKGRSALSVLVFATREGGTPVVMAGDAARPDLPLSIRLRLRADGQVEVLLPPTSYGDELPTEVARELTGLPQLVAEALA